MLQSISETKNKQTIHDIYLPNSHINPHDELLNDAAQCNTEFVRSPSTVALIAL